MAYPIYQYPPMMPQQAPPPITPQIPQFNNVPNVISGKVWVSGEAGAKAYLVAPNSDVTLWDSEQNVIYLKSADASGMPTMKILDYTIRGAENATTPPKEVEPINTAEFVLKSDYEALKGEIEDIKEQLKHVPRQSNRPKKGGNL